MSELTRFMKASGIPMDNVPATGTRVLVVDGDTEVVDVLGRVLAERDDYEVRTATTAFQAGLEVERFQPHFLLIDIHIGGGDGRDVAQLIRESESGRLTRIIAMSGRLTGGQAHTLRADGFDTILKKPFQVRQVLEAIEGAGTLAA